MTKRIKPNFLFENAVSLKCLALGVDEVGRGALAGTVVAGAVFLPGRPKFWLSLGIDDSKKLTAKRREELSLIIRDKAVWGIGESSVSYINSCGIVKANEQAMRRAVVQLMKKLSGKHCFILVDAFQIKFVPGVGLKNQKSIIKGDQKSISIAAASIIAKVHRDQLMSKLDTMYSVYGWKQNKGYGTKRHIEAIKFHGISRFHRKLFVDSLEIG